MELRLEQPCVPFHNMVYGRSSSFRFVSQVLYLTKRFGDINGLAKLGWCRIRIHDWSLNFFHARLEIYTSKEHHPYIEVVEVANVVEVAIILQCSFAIRGPSSPIWLGVQHSSKSTPLSSDIALDSQTSTSSSGTTRLFIHVRIQAYTRQIVVLEEGKKNRACRMTNKPD